MRKFTLLILLIISSTVFAAGIPWKPQTDVGQLGRASSGDPVELFFDVGDGASNPVLSVDKTAKTFDLSKSTRIQGDLTIGDGTPSDRNFIIDEGAGGNNPRLTWDTTTNKWKQFDGTAERDIGSGGGGGGGQNFFADKNPDAEGGTNNWTVTGTGTFSVFTSTPINGLTSFRWDSDLQNDVLRTDQVAIPEKFKGKACQIEFTFTGGTDDLVKPQVVNSSNVKLPGATYVNQDDGTDFLKAQTGIVTRAIPFICPNSGTIAFEFNQTAAGDPAIMDFDDIHIGELIGLKQSVLPDVVSAKFDADAANDPTVISQTVDWLAASPASRTGVGAYTITFKSGFFSIVPACTCTFANGTGALRVCTIDPVTTTSQIKVITEVSSDGQNFDSLDFDLICQKQGTDAQQTVQVLTLPPVIAEFENVFSVRIDADVASTTIFSKSSDWLDSPPVTRDALGLYTLNFKPGLFSVSPACFGTAIGTGGTTRDVTVRIFATTTSVQLAITDQGTTLTETDFNVECHRQGADVKSHKTSTVLVNQVHSSFNNGIRVESCRINNNGTATIDTGSGLCPSWISTVTRVSLGDVEIVPVVGTFSADPVCVTLTDRDGGAGLTMRSTTQTPTLIKIEAINTAIGLVDTDFFITCTGAR